MPCILVVWPATQTKAKGRGMKCFLTTVVLSATVGLVNGNYSFQLDSLGRDEDRCDMATGSSPFMRRTEEKEKGAATALPGQSRDRGIFLGFFQA